MISNSSKIYAGNREVSKIYAGNRLVFSSAWTPDNLGSSLALWLDASDASTVNVNETTGKVSSWLDKSGNGRHASQDTGSSQPAYTAGGLNGKSVLYFNGTSSFLSLTQFNTVTVFLLGNLGWPTRPQLSGAAPSEFKPTWNVSGKHIGYRSLGTGQIRFLNLGGQTSEFAFGCVQLDIAGAEIIMNGNGQPTASYAEAITVDDGRINTIGRDFDGTDQFFDGSIAEIITLSGLPSVDERQKLEGYFAHKWGLTANLPSDHPYKLAPPYKNPTPTLTITSQPQNTTASGGEASFAVAATVSDGSALAYQWEEETLTATGANWQQVSFPAGGWYGIAYGGGRFVVVGHGYAATSSNGSTWSTSAMPSPTISWLSVNYDSASGNFVAVSENRFARSSDGANWEAYSLPDEYLGNGDYVRWGPSAIGGGVYVAVSTYDSTNKAATGQNGTIWLKRILPATAFWRGIAYGDGKFVAVAYDTSIAATSENGTTWTQRTLPTTASWIAVGYGNGTFVAVAHNSNIAATSTDGVTWTQRTLPATANWHAVTHGNGAFVALAWNSNIVATSADGITWAQRTLPATADWWSAAYGDGKFIAVRSPSYDTAAVSSETLQFLPISGETSPTLNLTGLTTADDGERYRVVVDSPSVDPVTSNVATLSVPVTTTTTTATPTTTTAAPWTQLGADIDGEGVNNYSGWSVSLSDDGSRVAIGAPYNDGNSANSGHVRVYQWSGSAWTQLGADIDGAAFADESGRSVSLSGDGNRVAIGAPYYDANSSDFGHVRVYQWSGSAWTQLGADIYGEAANNYSGRSVSLNGDGSRVAIGAPDNDGVNGQNSGHVRVYSWNGSNWIQVGQDIDGETYSDSSGWSVSLSSDGSRVAIGAYLNQDNGTSSGHVRVYQWSGSAWTQLGTDIDGEAAGDRSGWSVSLSGDGSRVAIGALYNDGNGSNSGHVRVYQWSGSAWTQLAADIDGEAAGDQSGWSVSLSGDGSRVAIGAPYNDGNTTSSGHVRVYQWSGSAWTQLAADIDGEAFGDESGYSVSLSSDGNRVAIGARGNDGVNGQDSGHVRVYELTEEP